MGRSSLRTYLFRIVMNLARTRGVREARSAPFSSLIRDGEDGPRWVPSSSSARPTPGPATGPPRSGPWSASAEGLALSAEGLEKISQAIAELPETQRRVSTLRDVEGFGADEVSELLGLSDGNQRVLLHRARTKLRQALAEYYESPTSACASPPARSWPSSSRTTSRALCCRPSTRLRPAHRRLPRLHALHHPDAHDDRRRAPPAGRRHPTGRAQRPARLFPRLGGSAPQVGLAQPLVLEQVRGLALEHQAARSRARSRDRRSRARRCVLLDDEHATPTRAPA